MVAMYEGRHPKKMSRTVREEGVKVLINSSPVSLLRLSRVQQSLHVQLLPALKQTDIYHLQSPFGRVHPCIFAGGYSFFSRAGRFSPVAGTFRTFRLKIYTAYGMDMKIQRFNRSKIQGRVAGITAGSMHKTMPREV
jgi:hypothetical protein